MSDIQYPETGEKNVNFSAEDDCGNKTRGTRMITIIQKLLAGRYVDITESGDTATISVDPSPDYYNKNEINEILADLDTVQFKIVSALPAVGALNVIYLVQKTAPDTGYDQYIWNTDDNQFHAIGDTDIDLSDYYTKLQTYQKSEVYNKTEADNKFQEKLTDSGSISPVTDTTTFANLNLATKAVKSITGLSIWNYIVSKITGSASSAITTDLERSKVVVTDAFNKLNVSSVYSAELEQLRGINTTKTVQQQLDEKSDAYYEGEEIYTVTDDTKLYNIITGTKTFVPVACETIWKYIKTKINNGAAAWILYNKLPASVVAVSLANGEIAGSSVTTTQLNNLLGCVNSLAFSEGSGNGAFSYNSSTSAGYTISGDYDSSVPRRAWKMGGIANLSFQAKGSATANTANWTTIGTVANAFKPKYITPVVAQIFDQTSGNAAAGGYLHTDGRLVIWTNAKGASNNYQVRVNITYRVSS